MLKLFLIDYDGSSVELDTEGIDFGLDFKISNLSDLSARFGNITREITLKGTEVNNNAFGYIYRLGRTNDLGLDNKLFFNYNSLRQVDCLVYDDSNLLFRGTLRLISTVKNNGVIYYNVVLTDAVIDLMKFTQDKLLSDLDVNDLTHKYSIDSITQSWSRKTQRWNGVTYSNSPFEKGSGYVYGYVYYGMTPSGTWSGDNAVNIYDYRPSLYVKEIVDRIIGQTALSGFTWELKDSTGGLTERFNSLVLLNNQDKLASRVSNFQTKLTRSGSPGYSGFSTIGFTKRSKLRLDTLTQTGSNASITLLTPIDNYYWRLESDITADASFSVDYTISVNSTSTLKFSLQEVLEGEYTNTEVSYKYATLPGTSGTASGNVTMYVPKRTYKQGSKLYLTTTAYNIPGTVFNPTASFTIPYTTSDVLISTQYNSNITPTLPENIKQYDLLKSLMWMFNLYAYVEKSRPKHIIFQTYDDFYVYSQANYIVNTALDWSDKVIYNEDLKKSMNLTIPKSYVYTYKEDKDYINEDYKNGFNSVYGQLKFNDAYGVTDTKKVELIFSPSPLVQSNGKKFPMIRGGSDIEIKTTNSNPRIVYFNDLKSTDSYTVYYTSSGLPATASTLGIYGEVSEYYNPNTSTDLVDSLQFGLPRKTYFPFSATYSSLPNLYTRYHINQVTELTNSNLYTLECKVYLSEVDMALFDFRTPIYISTDIGNSYFKVLELSWKDAKTPASVKLQSIFFGVEN